MGSQPFQACVATNKQAEGPGPIDCKSLMRQLLHMHTTEINIFLTKRALRSMLRLDLFVLRKNRYSWLNTC